MDFAGDPLLAECFIHLPPLPICDTNPKDNQWIFTKQSETNKLLKYKHKFPDQYFFKILDEKEIIC